MRGRRSAHLGGERRRAGGRADRDDEVQVGDPALRQRADRVGEGRARIGVVHVVEDAAGRQPDADAVGAPDAGHRLDHLDQEARAVLDAAAVVVGALVGAVAQELVEQVAVGAVDLDAVEAGRLSARRAPCSSRRRCRDLGGRERARRRDAAGRSRCRSRPRRAIADGATGSAPCGGARCEMRPTCQSWRKIRPPAACTASVTRRQPATCSACRCRACGYPAVRRDLRRLGDDQPGARRAGRSTARARPARRRRRGASSAP